MVSILYGYSEHAAHVWKKIDLKRIYFEFATALDWDKQADKSHI